MRCAAFAVKRNMGLHPNRWPPASGVYGQAHTRGRAKLGGSTGFWVVCQAGPHRSRTTHLMYSCRPDRRCEETHPARVLRPVVSVAAAAALTILPEEMAGSYTGVRATCVQR